MCRERIGEEKNKTKTKKITQEKILIHLQKIIASIHEKVR